MIIDEIKKEYPNPVAYIEEQEDLTYCVGGAICKYMLSTKIDNFPDANLIREALKKLNPSLTWHYAGDYANAIIFANDHDDIEEAWELAREAENFNPEK